MIGRDSTPFHGVPAMVVFAKNLAINSIPPSPFVSLVIVSDLPIKTEVVVPIVFCIAE